MGILLQVVGSHLEDLHDDMFLQQFNKETDVWFYLKKTTAREIMINVHMRHCKQTVS